jgi:hypothetical protein
LSGSLLKASLDEQREGRIEPRHPTIPSPGSTLRNHHIQLTSHMNGKYYRLITPIAESQEYLTAMFACIGQSFKSGNIGNIIAKATEIRLNLFARDGLMPCQPLKGYGQSSSCFTLQADNVGWRDIALQCLIHDHFKIISISLIASRINNPRPIVLHYL